MYSNIDCSQPESIRLVVSNNGVNYWKAGSVTLLLLSVFSQELTIPILDKPLITNTTLSYLESYEVSYEDFNIVMKPPVFKKVKVKLGKIKTLSLKESNDNERA